MDAISALRILQVSACLLLYFFHGTIPGRAGCCTEGTLTMQSNSVTNMFTYLLKSRVVWQAVLQYAVSLSGNQGTAVKGCASRKGLQGHSEGMVHWAWLTNFLSVQMQTDSSRTAREGNYGLLWIETTSPPSGKAHKVNYIADLCLLQRALQKLL